MFRKELSIAKKDMLICAGIALAIVVLFTVIGVIVAAETYAEGEALLMISMMFAMVIILQSVYLAFGMINTNFHISIALGMRRRDFLFSMCGITFGVLLLNMVILSLYAFLMLRITAFAAGFDEAFVRTSFEYGMLKEILRPGLILAATLVLTVFTLFIGSMMIRFGKTFYLVFWMGFILLMNIIPRVLDYFGLEEKLAKFFITLPVKQLFTIGGIAGVVILAVMAFISWLVIRSSVVRL